MPNPDAPAPALFPATLMPDADWWSALWPDPRAVIEALGLAPGQSAVDLCCGDGHFTPALASIARTVVAIDLDAALLALAGDRCATARLTNCTFVQGDAYDVRDLAPEPVDFILMANTFHGVPDQPRLCAAIAATLVPGGTLAIVNWLPRPRADTTVLGVARGPRDELRMSPDRVDAVAEGCGLLKAGFVALPPYHYGAIYQKPL